MDIIHPDPSNTNISTTNEGGALRMTCGTKYFPNSNRLLYCPIQTCRMISVPLILGISYSETAGTFATPYLICVEMPQILE